MRTLLRAPQLVIALALALVLGLTRLAAQDINIETLPRLRLIEEMHISDSGDSTVGFSRTGSVDVDRDGQIYVYFSIADQIRVFDPAGRFLRTIGPARLAGEFPTGRMGVVGDTVWVASVMPSRVTLFDRAGRMLSTALSEIPVLLPGSWGLVAPFAMRADGKLTSYMAGGRGALFPNGRDQPGVRPISTLKATDTVPYPRVLFNAQGEVLDTVGWDQWLPSQGEADQRLLVVFPEGRFMVDRDAPRTSGRSTFRVTRIGYGGDTVYAQGYGYRPVLNVDVLLDSLSAAATTRPGAPSASVIPWTGTSPMYQTPIRGTIVGGDGALWLSLAREETAAPHWVLLDPTGQPRGQFELPTMTRIVWSRGDVVWAIAPSQNNVTSLVKYRIAP